MISIDFSGKNALITGASGGMGIGIARSFAKAGAKLYLADLRPEGMEAPAKEFRAMGVEVSCHQLDITDEPAVIKLIGEIVANDGKIDILVNNAGIIINKHYMDNTAEEFERVYAVNLIGVHKCTHAALTHMIKRGEGKIVNIASASSRKGTWLQAPYSASKFAVQSLTQSAALEVADKNINVNAICPGFVQTGMEGPTFGKMAELQGASVEQVTQNIIARIPQKRFQPADAIGDAAVFLASPLAENITGQALNVDGGFNMN